MKTFKKGAQKTMNQALKDREPVTRALCRLIYGEGLAFNLVKSPLWKEALRLVGEYGKGLKLPSYHEARVAYLKKKVECVEEGLDKYKEEWKKMGCTLMSDGWTDGKQRSITNFLVNSPSGTVFVRSIDTSSFAKDANKLFDMLNSVIEEIGEKNVVQVITDSASAYVLAGSKLEKESPHLYWSPCAAHLIDLMLQDIGGGKTFKDTLVDFNFWKAIKYCLGCVVPIFKVLRLMDGDVKPAMGYIYEAMDLAKEQIKENFHGVESRYKPIWENIDLRWNMQLHRPLHAAGYYLNPSLHFEENFNADKEVKGGLYDVIERMYDRRTMVTIHEQLVKFNESIGMFGISAAMLMRKKMQPAKWWSSYGDECPELQHLAIRVLSLTCSATGCERNWSTFDHIHSKKRNYLEQRLNALVFVKYNLNLDMRLEKRKERGETYDPICLSVMESYDEWITEKEDVCLPEDISWMDVHECFKEDEGTSANKRKRGPRNLNKVPNVKDKGKRQLVDVDDADEDDEEGDEDDIGLHETVVVEDEDEDDGHFNPEI